MPILYLDFISQALFNLIVLTCLLLILMQIHKLRRSVPQEVTKQILPHLSLEISEKDMTFYLKNEGYLPAKGVRIEDTEVLVEDGGFKTVYVLKFEMVELIEPKRKVSLKFDVYDKEGRFLPEATERLFVHLLLPPFKVRASFSNVDGQKFSVVFSKRGEKFYIGENQDL